MVTGSELGRLPNLKQMSNWIKFQQDRRAVNNCEKKSSFFLKTPCEKKPANINLDVN